MSRARSLFVMTTGRLSAQGQHDPRGCTGDCADGKHPHAGLILDTDGNLYGTTTDRGVAFRLNPDTQQFDVLHAIGETYAPLSFKGARFNGHAPLYGTIARGGEFGRGAVFALEPRDDGTWRKDILWNFCRRRHCRDGSHPFGGVYVADDGHLVGATQHGGGEVTNSGVIYELTHRQMTGILPLGFTGKFVTPLYVPRANGYFVPLRGGLIEYYGAGGGYTNWGGFSRGRDDLGGAVENPNNWDVVGTASRDASTAFDPEGGGTIWLFSRLAHGLYDVHWFCQEAACADGDRPAAPPVFGGDYDVYYGTTTKGGAHGQGVVYRYEYSSPPS